jgi:5-methylcytosine-specific restriction protein A
MKEIMSWEDAIEEAKAELELGEGYIEDREEVVETAREILRGEAKGIHRSYLTSPRWIKLREIILKRDKYECQDCIQSLKKLLEKLNFIPLNIHPSQIATQVHHTDYGYLWTEQEEKYCISVCGLCHQIRHAEFSFKKILELQRENQLLIKIYYELLKQLGGINQANLLHQQELSALLIQP